MQTPRKMRRRSLAAWLARLAELTDGNNNDPLARLSELEEDILNVRQLQRRKRARRSAGADASAAQLAAVEDELLEREDAEEQRASDAVARQAVPVFECGAEVVEKEVHAVDSSWCGAVVREGAAAAASELARLQKARGPAALVFKKPPRRRKRRKRDRERERKRHM